MRGKGAERPWREISRIIIWCRRCRGRCWQDRLHSRTERYWTRVRTIRAAGAASALAEASGRAAGRISMGTWNGASAENCRKNGSSMWASSTSSEQKKMSTDSPVARLDPAVMGEELHRSRHQSLYPAIRRPQTASRCWLLAAEGRPQYQGTKASQPHSIKAPKACIPRSAGRRSQVAAGCWRLKADRSIKAPKHQSTKASQPHSPFYVVQ